MSLNKLFLGMGIAASLAVPSFSQATKPAESTSKVKKVLHYNKIGGWRHEDGIKDLTDNLNRLAAKKGFTVTHTADVAQINLANLKTYSAIIWDNNTNGGLSIPGDAPRQAVVDYVNQGGGWLLVHGAGDHANTWPVIQTAIGTTFTTHGAQGAGDVIFDAEAKAHKELKYMIQDLPPTARLTKDEWYSFQNTLRGKAGFVVVAIAGNSTAAIMPALGDNSKPEDHTYIWAKEGMGTGRVLYTAIGHGGNQLYAQADSFSNKALWENIRYVAGDYQNGCTNLTASNYNAAARVNDGSCATTGIGASNKTLSDLRVEFSGFKGQGVTVAFTHSGKYSLELRNAAGVLVWKNYSLEQSAVEINHSLRPGVYYLKAANGKNTASQKFILM